MKHHDIYLIAAQIWIVGGLICPQEQKIWGAVCLLVGIAYSVLYLRLNHTEHERLKKLAEQNSKP